MKILVIGGSYFYGRVFVMAAAKEHDVTVLNRGTYSMEACKVRQVICDRHDRDRLQALPEGKEDYDAVIDFCAYEEGDISQVVESLTGVIGQYVFISTVDVYERGGGVRKTEQTPFERRHLEGEAGSYIAGKVMLEEELRRVCMAKQIPYCSIRPAILYGPYNYAPRESVYIQMLLKNRALPSFTDADGGFQLVYVKDAAEAILNCIGNEKSYGQAYNLCGDEIMTYDKFFAALKAAARQEDTAGLQEIRLTVEEAVKQGVPVPFPAKAEETHLCDNTKSKAELGMEYLPFEEGLRRTYEAFRPVFV